MRMPPLDTERLIIRPLIMDDLDACYRLYQGVGWIDSALPAHEFRARQKAWLEWSIRNYEALAWLHQTPYGDYAVTRKVDGSFLGLAGLVPALAPFGRLQSFGGDPDAHFTAEVGLFWVIAPEAQRQGIASEAAQALLDFAFGTLRVARVIASTEHDNCASIGVMRKLGMRIERNPQGEPRWFQTVGVLEPPHPPSMAQDRKLSAC